MKAEVEPKINMMMPLWFLGHVFSNSYSFSGSCESSGGFLEEELSDLHTPQREWWEWLVWGAAGTFHPCGVLSYTWVWIGNICYCAQHNLDIPVVNVPVLSGYVSVLTLHLLRYLFYTIVNTTQLSHAQNLVFIRQISRKRLAFVPSSVSLPPYCWCNESCKETQ